MQRYEKIFRDTKKFATFATNFYVKATMKAKWMLCAAAAIVLAACGNEEPREAEIGRLDLELRNMAACDSPAVSEANLPGAKLMFSAMGYDSISPELLRWWSTSDVVSVFQHDVDSVYTDLTPARRQLGVILDRAAKEDLRLPDMKFYTVVWGNPRPLLRDSDVMVIALNHYLGASYPGYSHWEEYRRAGKTPEALPYDLAAALTATQIPMAGDGEATLLDWMLYEGGLVEARMRLVEGADLAHALGYTPEQLKWCEDNYDDMMREMAARRMVHDTDPVLIDRMLAPAPSSPLLAGSAPGRVGRYIGYRLVKDYLREHPKATLREVMEIKSSEIR